MNILLLSDHSSLHMLLQHVMQGHAPESQVWRTHTLASALPYLRQEPEIDAVMLDITLCGWSRLATLVTTIRPCLGGRKLILLIDESRDEVLVRAHGVTVDLCLSKATGVTEMVDQMLYRNTQSPTAPSGMIASAGAAFLCTTKSAGGFTQLNW